MLLQKVGAMVGCASVVAAVWPPPRSVVTSTRLADETRTADGGITSDAAKHAVRCSPPGTDACVRKCEAIQAYCVHRAKHPFSPSSGIGDLYYCESDRGQWQCRYRYANGDICVRQMPRAKWKCRYTTPQEEPEHEHP